jgi:type IV pilus assembly protein PilN
VILINLLPHREAARKAQARVVLCDAGVSAVVGRRDRGAIFLWYQAQISNAAGQNRCCKTRSSVWKADQGHCQSAGRNCALACAPAGGGRFQADRNLPVHLLNEIVRQLPDGVYITTMRQVNQAVTIQGVAQSNERVSELLRNLANNSEWLTTPELVEIVAQREHLGAREQRRVSNFQYPGPDWCAPARRSAPSRCRQSRPLLESRRPDTMATQITSQN